MSHFSDVKTEIRDMKALEQAIQNMGLEITRNTTCRYYFGSQDRDFVVKLPRPSRYDMAIKPNSDGTYSLEADFYPEGRVAEVIGEDGCHVVRQYAIEKLRIEATKRGYRVYERGDHPIVMDPNNPSVKLKVTIEQNGNMSFKVIGAKGRGCMQFQGLEEAMGSISKRGYTSEYYESEDQQRERVRSK